MYDISEDGITPQKAAELCGGKLFGKNGKKIYGVSTDSRKIKENDLFFALVGENFDGNVFIPQAMEKGAVCAVTSRKDSFPFPYILVDDTLKALGEFAKNYKSRFSLLTVGVTGSVGKTSTKEFIYAVLSQKCKTAKTDGNFNNEIGMPLTLIGIDSSYKAAVIEMGMRGMGEISYLTKIARPDIAVITNIGTSHLENLGTRENIAKAKLEIAEGLPDDGILILNGDEPLLKNIGNIKNKVIYAGINDKNCDYLAYNIKEFPDFISFSVKCPENKILEDIKIPVVGVHNVLNSLYAIVIGLISGMDENSVREGLFAFKGVKLRGEISNKNGVTVIEDCYNASPESMRASLMVLSHIAKENGGRKIAFLGDMKELGDDSAKMHFEVGKYAAESGTDILFTFGSDAQNIAEGAIQNGFPKENIYKITDTENTDGAIEVLSKVLKKGDTVLFKASRALMLERISSKIK